MCEYVYKETRNICTCEESHAVLEKKPAGRSYVGGLGGHMPSKNK